MKKVSIVLFQLGILFITLIVLLIAAFILPVVARDFATETPEWAYLQYPLLIAIYVTLIPFLVAIFQAFKLSRLIQLNQVFSMAAARNLKIIKVSGFIISFLYLGVPSFFLILLSSLRALPCWALSSCCLLP